MFVLLAALTVTANFDGGNIGKVEVLSPTHIRCALTGQVDQDGRNRQANAYYFRVDGAKGQQITIDLVNLPGEYNYVPNQGAVTKDTVPVSSEDNRTWDNVAGIEFDAKVPQLRMRVTPKGNRIWISHVPPYTNDQLARLISAARYRPNFKSEDIGKSVKGRPLFLFTITDSKVPEANKKVIWLMARQHSWESFSSWVAEGAVRFLLSDEPEAKQLRQGAIWKILPAADPDGLASGGVRFNAHGFDLNRNWDIEDPIKMPEITAQRKAIFGWLDGGHHVDLFLSMHNTETSEYLEGPPNSDGRFKALGERFFTLLKEKTTFAPTRELTWAAETTSSGKAGRMNVSQGLWRDRQLPAFISEQRISMNSKLGRIATIDDRMKYGVELVQAMFTAVQAK